MWSTQKMNAEILTVAIKDELYKRNKKNYQFALVWATLNTNVGVKFIQNNPQRRNQQQAKAYHIEVPTEQKQETYRAMAKFLTRAQLQQF